MPVKRGTLLRAAALSSSGGDARTRDLGLSPSEAVPLMTGEAGDGDVLSCPPHEERVSGAVFSFSPPKPPAVRCGCADCLIAAVQSPTAERGQLSACESIRRKRERSLFGLQGRDPGQGFLLRELAQFLRLPRSTVYRAAKRLGISRKLEGDHCFAPLTRRQAKRLIQACRVK